MSENPTDPQWGVAELMACVFARDIPDGVFGACGMHSEIGLVACILAQRTTAPNLTVQVGPVINPSVQRLPNSAMDSAIANTAEAILPGEQSIWNLSRPRASFEFFGGLQIDGRGNVNLMGVTDMLGPGAAAGSAAPGYEFCYLYTHRHEPRVFVESCDYVTVPGHPTVTGGPARSRGPRLLVTPLCVFDFDMQPDLPDGPIIRLRSVHPGVSVSDVIDATGFRFRVGSVAVPITAPPTPLELEILRSIDGTGVLRSKLDR